MPPTTKKTAKAKPAIKKKIKKAPSKKAAQNIITNTINVNQIKPKPKPRTKTKAKSKSKNSLGASFDNTNIVQSLREAQIQNQINSIGAQRNQLALESSRAQMLNLMGRSPDIDELNPPSILGTEFSLKTTKMPNLKKKSITTPLEQYGTAQYPSSDEYYASLGRAREEGEAEEKEAELRETKRREADAELQAALYKPFLKKPAYRPLRNPSITMTVSSSNRASYPTYWAEDENGKKQKIGKSDYEYLKENE